MPKSIENREADACDAVSGGLHREHSLDVPAQGHQVPLAFNVFEASQHCLPIAHHRFNDAEHRLRSLLAQGVNLSGLPVIEWVESAPKRGSEA